MQLRLSHAFGKETSGHTPDVAEASAAGGWRRDTPVLSQRAGQGWVRIEDGEVSVPLGGALSTHTDTSKRQDRPKLSIRLRGQLLQVSTARQLCKTTLHPRSRTLRIRAWAIDEFSEYPWSSFRLRSLSRSLLPYCPRKTPGSPSPCESPAQPQTCVLGGGRMFDSAQTAALRFLGFYNPRTRCLELGIFIVLRLK
jgi:hypothetical protein